MLAAGKRWDLLVPEEGKVKASISTKRHLCCQMEKRIAPKFVNDMKSRKSSEFFTYKSIDQRKLFTTGSKAINVQGHKLCLKAVQASLLTVAKER